MTGASTLASLSATNITASGTLGVTGASTLSTLTVTGNSTLASLNATNITASGTLGVTGASTLASLSATNITASGTLGVTGISTLATVNATSISNTGNESIGGNLLLQNLVTLTAVTSAAPTVQGGSNVALNAFRIRTNDTSNTSARLSIANVATGANYYDSGITLYSLGNNDANTNSERLSFGINANGGYLNHLYAGTGVARSFNMMGGATFTTGGSLALASTLSVTGASTLASLNLSGLLTSTNTTDSTSSSSASAINTPGGLSVAKSANIGGLLGVLSASDYNVASPTSSALYCAGGAYIAKSLGFGQSAVLINGGMSATASTQSGTTTNTNIIRLLSNDATNPNVRASVANMAMGTTYYDSSVVLWTLGSTGASTNYERMILGVNSSGGYLNYLYGGTGTLKTFNLFGGAIFSNGGTLTLSSPTNATTSTNGGALTVTGGAGIAKDTYIGGVLRVADPTPATSVTTGSVVTSGGVAATNVWTNGLTNSYAMTAIWYSSTTAVPVANRTIITMGVAWTLQASTGSDMTGLFASASGKANQYTIVWPGTYSISFTIRFAAVNANSVVETWLNCANSSFYGTNNTRLGKEATLCGTQQISVGASHIGYFAAGDVITPQLFVTLGTSSTNNSSIGTGTDCTTTITCLMRHG